MIRTCSRSNDVAEVMEMNRFLSLVEGMGVERHIEHVFYDSKWLRLRRCLRSVLRLLDPGPYVQCGDTDRQCRHAWRNDDGNKRRQS